MSFMITKRSNINPLGKKKGLRAYSTLEITVAATLGALLISAIVAWAGGVARVVSAGVNAGDGGQTVLLMSRMRDDLLTGAHCDPSGRDSIVRNLSTTQIDFVVGKDSTRSMVSYRFSEGVVERAETVMPSDCSTPEQSSWVEAGNGYLAAGNFLAPVREGVLGGNEGDYISCTEIFTDGCAVDAIAVLLVRSTTGEISQGTMGVAK
jgi:hypothetical protein